MYSLSEVESRKYIKEEMVLFVGRCINGTHSVFIILVGERKPVTSDDLGLHVDSWYSLSLLSCIESP